MGHPINICSWHVGNYAIPVILPKISSGWSEWSGLNADCSAPSPSLSDFGDKIDSGKVKAMTRRGASTNSYIGGEMQGDTSG